MAGPEGIAEVNGALQEAADKTGRAVSTYLSYMVILGETDKDAWRKVELYNTTPGSKMMAVRMPHAREGTNPGARSAPP